jgi:hypothetical protein
MFIAEESIKNQPYENIARKRQENKIKLELCYAMDQSHL